MLYKKPIAPFGAIGFLFSAGCQALTFYAFFAYLCRDEAY
jgi:hypothetical protein